jgi:8-oxo-dGTP pyrophosphatase MutT (NUDIX family)
MDAPRQALHDALLAHVPADDAERRDRDAIAELVATTDRCFDRTLYEPGHVTGSAFVVDASSGCVLLHHHRRLGRWLQLGGHDEGEHDPLATALREAREESGLLDLRPLSTAILDVDVHVIPAHRAEPPHQHHDVRYALQTSMPATISQLDEESFDLAWLDLEEAARRMAEPGADRALRRLAALLG